MDDEFQGEDTELAEQDLVELREFRAFFEAEGLSGVSVWCDDCRDDHYYGWDILEANLTALIETGETPVHEPAYSPRPADYVPWQYARGYLDALRNAGLDQRLALGSCPGCGYVLAGELGQANFCPRCGSPLLLPRLEQALADLLDPATLQEVLRRAGFLLPGPLDPSA